MARFQGNNPVMILNSVDLNPYFIDIEVTNSATEQDTTAGGGAEYSEAAPGLYVITFSGTIELDDAAIVSIFSTMRPGVYSFDFGPNGNTSGNVRFLGNVFLSESSMQGQSVEKTPVSFTFNARSTGTPTEDPFNGGAY